MAAPTLRLRRGSGAPSGSIAVVAEPFFDTSGNLYVATAADTFAHIGGSTYTSRVDNFLTDAVASTSSAILSLEDQQATPGSVSLDVPSSVTDYTLTFPAALPGTGGNYFLQIDQGTGDMSFVAAGSGAASQVSTVTNSTDDTFFLTFVDSDNGTAGDESVFTDAGVSYNPSTNLLTVTGEVDAGSIDVGSTGIDIAGSTSGTVTLVTPAEAGTTTITFPATSGTVVTTGDTGTVTSTMIANGTIANDDISGSAAIDFSKLAALTGGNILVGNGSNVATSVAASGDVSIDNTGAFSVNSVQENSVALGTDTTGQYASTITGGSGITATAANADDATAYTIAIDSSVATLTGTQTLTNKTLTSPVLTTPQINDTTADHQYIFAVSELLADRTVTLPLLTGNDTFVFEAHTQTLTNKTIDGGSNTLSNIANGSLTNSSITIGNDAISLGGTQTDLNGITSLDVDNITIDGNTVTTSTGNLTLDSAGGTVSVNDNLTVTGNLNVVGTTTTVNTTSVLIQDPLQELGLEDNSGTLQAPTGTTGSIDRGLKLHYHDGTAAFEAYMIFDASTQRMVFAVDGTDSSNEVSVADPDFATIHAKGLYVTHQNDAGDTAVGNVVTIAALGEDETEAEGLFTAGNGVAGVYLLNTTIDCGTY